VINSIRANRAEFGIGAPEGPEGSRNCCMLLPTQATNECLKLPVHALPRLALNYSASRSRLWSLIG
jgi:hypothetical protein